MSNLSAVSLIVVVAAAAGLLSLFVQTRVQVAHRKAHQEYGTVVFLQLGVVFAVLLAFVFSSCWEGYNEAAQSVDLECGALHGAAMIAATLPEDQARRVLSLEATYIRSVVFVEWPHVARHRAESLATDNELVALVEAAARLPGLDARQSDGRNQIELLLAQAHAQRENRIFQASLGVPILLWTILVAFSTVLVVFVSLSGIEQKLVAITFTATFAAAIASILILARLLDYPFEGGLALAPNDFVSLLSKVTGLLQSV